MTHYICALTGCLDNQRVYVVHKIFHKCRKSEVRGEFWSFWCGLRYRLRLGFPDPKRYGNSEHFENILRESPCEEYLSKLEEAYPELRGTLHLQLVKCTEIEDDFDRVYLSLDRPTLYARILPKVLTDGVYGSCDIFEGKVVNVSLDDTIDDSPTQYRVQMIWEIITNVVRRCGALDTSEEGSLLNFHVTHKQTIAGSGDHVIFVEKVKCLNSAGDHIVSMDECKRSCTDELALMSEHRLGDESDVAFDSLDTMTRASLMFAFINGNISKKAVTLKLDENITPFCKGAVFVLYNYCRMAHIIHKYKKMESAGSYPPLPDVESVDFTLLSKPEEWSMMYEYVIWWPKVFESIVSDLSRGDFKVHKIIEFLKSLASDFSAYYRRTRVLTEPRQNLLPVLQARMYLILALMKVYKTALDILGLQSIQNM